MKVRGSGMPEEQMWRGSFDPPAILSKLGFTDTERDVVDFGCGYGTFALAAAVSAKGMMHAFDLDQQMIAATDRKAEALGLPNVRTVLRDFVEEGTDLPDDLARRSVSGLPSTITDLDVVTDTARRAQCLVNRILLFTRATEPVRVTASFETPVREAIQLLRAGLPPDIEIHEKIDPDTPQVLADGNELHEIAMNRPPMPLMP
jgi:SAM-dependent methyltransferase